MRPKTRAAVCLLVSYNTLALDGSVVGGKVLYRHGRPSPASF